MEIEPRSEAQDSDAPLNSRWTMMRDLAVFQVKLIVDGLRDFLLVPASLVVGIVSLFSGNDGRPAPHFYELLRLGKRSERWINLFGALDHAPGGDAADEADDASIDDLVQRVESYVVDEYRRGGVTQQAKQRIDDALDAIQRNRRSKDSE